MSPSDDNVKKLLAELFAQPQQQVPPGNPIADYLDNRAFESGTMSAAGAAAGVPMLGLGLGEALEGNPAGLLAALLSSGVLYGSASNAKDASRASKGADMWANKFGNGDPNQGMPGTPSGPAWRRK